MHRWVLTFGRKKQKKEKTVVIVNHKLTYWTVRLLSSDKNMLHKFLMGLISDKQHTGYRNRKYTY